MIDVETAGSPGWMLRRLNRKLADRMPRLDRLYARYEGRPPKSAGMAAESEAFQRFWEKSRTNFAEMIIRAVRTRMSIMAIRTAVEGGELGDQRAWTLCRQCGLDVAFGDVHRNFLIAGDSYVIVGMHEGELAVTAEDPRQVVTMHDPVQQSRIRYAGKFFHDEDEQRDYAYLYTPTRRHVAQRRRKVAGQINFNAGWEWDETRGGEAGEAHGYGRVPVVRFRNEEGVGEFERHEPLLDRIDHITLQGMVVATMQAFKQRALMVAPEDMPDEDENGDPIDYTEVLTSAPDKMWKLPATAELWESGVVDLTPILSSNDKNIQELSAVTFTPLSMFSPDGANQSAEGASLHREGLVTKASDRIARASHGWAEVVSLMFTIVSRDGRGEPGDAERAEVQSITIDWFPIERYGLAERYSAAVQAVSAGVPWRTRMAKVLQFTPAEVNRMEVERQADLEHESDKEINGPRTAAEPAGDPSAEPAEPAELAGAGAPAEAGG